jgi:hypothetical protein
MPHNQLPLDDDWALEDFKEMPTKLHPDADPFLITVLNQMITNAVFNDDVPKNTDLLSDISGWMDAEELSTAIYTEKQPLSTKAKLLKAEVEQCREYYIGRLVEEKLSSRSRLRSEFVTDLKLALDAKGIINPDYVGLYNTLLTMYDNDKTWDFMVKHTKSLPPIQEDNYAGHTVELQFLTQTRSGSNKSKSRKSSYKNMYFTDSDGHLYEYTIQLPNPLIPFIEQHFQTNNQFKKATKSVSVRRKRVSSPVPLYAEDFHYYKIYDFVVLYQGE